MINKQLDTRMRIDEDDERSVLAMISTTAVDSDGDVLLPSGVDLQDFNKNPVVLFGHDQRQIPVGKASRIQKKAQGILAKVQFAERPPSLPDVQEWPPDTLFDLFKQGILRAFSVGFTVPRGGSRKATRKDADRFGEMVERVITKWRLKEFSVVPVPANQDALAVAVSKGCIPNAWVLHELEGPEDFEFTDRKVESTKRLQIPVRRISM
jgi:HK97 family phage prohead protease